MKAGVVNRLSAEFDAKSENEALSRVLTAGFLMGLGVTAEELADLKTAVSEAVTNSIVHGYRDVSGGRVRLDLKLYSDGRVKISVSDRGCGIADIAAAREPFFTTDREHERSGMGFAVMETFTDRLSVLSHVGRGTRVTLEKRLSRWAA